MSISASLSTWRTPYLSLEQILGGRLPSKKQVKSWRRDDRYDRMLTVCHLVTWPWFLCRKNCKIESKPLAISIHWHSIDCRHHVWFCGFSAFQNLDLRSPLGVVFLHVHCDSQKNFLDFVVLQQTILSFSLASTFIGLSFTCLQVFGFVPMVWWRTFNYSFWRRSCVHSSIFAI